MKPSSFVAPNPIPSPHAPDVSSESSSSVLIGRSEEKSEDERVSMEKFYEKE